MNRDLFVLASASVLVLGLAGTPVSLAADDAAASDQSATGPSAAPTSNTAQQGATETSQLQEVIVTSERRTEDIQSISNTVKAISAETMTAAGVNDLTQIQQVAPEVSVQGGSFQVVNIRGVRTGAYGPTTDSPNATYIDGVYLARYTGLNGLFFDMSRVEVLDGPQGTLYGRNSVGGLLNIITNKPTETFGGYASMEFGNYNDVTTQAALNLPLTDTLAVRAAFFEFRHSGYYTDTGEDDANQTAGRFLLQWKPSDQDTLLLTGDLAYIGGKGGVAANVPGEPVLTVFKNPTVCMPPGGGAEYLSGPGGACNPGDTGQVVPIRTTDSPFHNSTVAGSANLDAVDTRNYGFLLQYDHNFGHLANLTFVGSHRSTYTWNLTGYDTGLEQNPLLIGAGVFGGASNNANYGFLPAYSEWNQGELRLTSIDTKPLAWTVGLFYFHERATNNGLGNFATVGTPTGGLEMVDSTAPVGQNVADSNAYAYNVWSQLNNDNAHAAYGQATWTPSFLSKLHVTGGLRYNWEEKHGIGWDYIGGVGEINNFDLSKTWTKNTYKANVAFDLTASNMVYVDYSTGFNAGGFAYGRFPEYEPETIKAWEIGSKNQFFNNTLQVNVAAWYYNYDDLVTTVTDIIQLYGFAFPFITVANAGNAVFRGQSLDLQWAPTRNDLIKVDVEHMDAQYLSYNLTSRYVNGNYFNYCAGTPSGACPPGMPGVNYFPGYSQTGNQSQPSFNYNHTTVGGDPEWTLLASAEHTFHVAKAGWRVELMAHYQSSTPAAGQLAPFNYPYQSLYITPSYVTFDTFLHYEPADKPWSVTAFARNAFNRQFLLDRNYQVYGINPTSGGGGALNGLPYSNPAVLFAYATGQYGPPRTFGLIFEARF
jgi:iron complex outermembrane receptor protein